MNIERGIGREQSLRDELGTKSRPADTDEEHMTESAVVRRLNLPREDFRGERFDRGTHLADPFALGLGSERGIAQPVMPDGTALVRIHDLPRFRRGAVAKGAGDFLLHFR